VFVVENLRNIGRYTLQLQAMLNENGGITVISGKHLPSHIINFSITGIFRLNVTTRYRFSF